MARKKNQDTFITPLNDHEMEVYQLYRKLQDALVKQDMDTFDKLVDDNTKFRQMSGKLIKKDEFKDEFATGKLKYTHVDLLKVQVLVTPDDEDLAELNQDVAADESTEAESPAILGDAHATLTCVAMIKGKKYGMTKVYPLHTMASFIRRDGQWKYVGE